MPTKLHPLPKTPTASLAMPKTSEEWIEIVKSFGLPVVLLGLAAYLLWYQSVDHVTFIRTELMDLNRQTIKVIENSTRSTDASVRITEQCVDALECNQELLLRLEKKL